MCDDEPMILRTNGRAASPRRRPGPTLRSLVVNLPEVWFLLRLLPGASVVIPGMRTSDGHARVDLAPEGLEGVVPAATVRSLWLVRCFIICEV